MDDLAPDGYLSHLPGDFSDRNKTVFKIPSVENIGIVAFFLIGTEFPAFPGKVRGPFAAAAGRQIPACCRKGLCPGTIAGGGTGRKIL